MKKHLLSHFAFGIAALLASAVFAEDDYSKVQIKTEKLTANIYMLTGAGGNIGLAVGNDAVFLIDDQFAPLTPKIKAAIAKITKKPIKFVINTHWHFDHVGGNENFGKAGAMIVAHENVRFRMSTEQVIEFFKMKTPPAPPKALPIITFMNDMTFHMNGDEILVFYLPNAHTDGDAFVHFRQSNVIHMGDTFFNKLYPFIDISSGGSVEGMINAAESVLSLTDNETKIIPGHGPLGNMADLAAYRDMLVAVSERIGAQIKEGKTLEQVIAAKPTAEFDAVWGKGFLAPAQFVEIVYKSLRVQG
jgi:cyclase